MVMVNTWCLTALSAQTVYIMLQEYEIYCVGLGQYNNEPIHKNRKVISALRPRLCGDNLLTM